MNKPTERARISKEPIGVLLPVFNQSAGLETIAESWLRALAKLGRPFELIVIDDASTDDTAAIAAKLAGRHTEVRLLRREVRQGYGACLRTGLAAATNPLIFYTSCDYPYQPADLGKLLEAIDEVDVATGIRTDPVPAWLRRLGGFYRLFVRVVFGIVAEPRPGWRGWRAWWQAVKWRWLFGLRFWDVPSAFKLYRRSLLDRIPIQSNGPFVHAELLAKANFLGCLMAEVPIGRLAGNFKGVAESPTAAGSRDAPRLFRRPEFKKVP